MNLFFKAQVFLIMFFSPFLLVQSTPIPLCMVLNSTVDEQVLETFLISQRPALTKFDRTSNSISADYDPLCPQDLHPLREIYKASGLEGNLLLGNRVATTMDLANDYYQVPDLIVIAREQSGGVARKGQWLSPPGDLYMTANVVYHNLSHKNYIQSIAAISVVQVIKELYADKRLSVSFEWPNVINWNKGTKIGGVLVKQHPFNQSLFMVGIGLRINSTIVPNLKAAIAAHNAMYNMDLQIIPLEKMAVVIIKRLKENLEKFANDPNYVNDELLDGIKFKEFHINFRGTVTGIGADAALVLQDPQGMKIMVDPDSSEISSQASIQPARQ